MEFKVIIPQWENHYVKSQKKASKYWKWQEVSRMPLKHLTVLRETPIKVGNYLYACDSEGNRFLKNTKTAGKPNIWIMNGQDLYNGTLNWRLRKSIAKYFHEYFSKYIKEQLKPLEISEGMKISVSCDIYEIRRGNMPDISNMWLLEKFFEDALQECSIIPDDNPDYIIESGRKKYYWVNNPEERKLIFTIKYIK